MSDLTPLVPRLGPLLGKLASDHDPEVIAAVRALRRVLASAGFSFNDLAAALGAVPYEDPEEAERVRWWAELAGLAERRGYKAMWVSFTFADRFPDHDPPVPEPEPRMPSAEVQRWTRNRAARWARQNLRAGR